MNGKEAIKLHMKKGDFILIGFCLLAAFILSVFLIGSGGDAKTLRISYNGQIMMTMELTESKLPKNQGTDYNSQCIYYLITYENSLAVASKSEERPEIPAGVSYNLVCILPGEVKMEAADCRDQICVHHTPIRSGGERIICLPHKLVVEITGTQQDEMTDGMVK